MMEKVWRSDPVAAEGTRGPRGPHKPQGRAGWSALKDTLRPQAPRRSPTPLPPRARFSSLWRPQ